VKTYDLNSAEDETPIGLAQASDGGYIVGIRGIQVSPFTSYAMRIDAVGDTVWTTPVTVHSANAMVVSDNDDLLMAGGIGTAEAAKYSGTGTAIWSHSYGGRNESWRAYDVAATPDGYLLVGRFRSRFGILKIDQDGDSVWTVLIGDSGSSVAQTVSRANSGNYIVAGVNQAADAALLVTVSNSGQLGWQQAVVAQGGVSVSQVMQRADGTVLLSGATNSQMWECALSAEGIPQWQRTYPNAPGVSEMREGPANSLILFGTSLLHGQDFLFMRTSETGAVEWTRSYLTSRSEWARTFIQCADGGYLLAGSSAGLSATEVLLIKVDGNGEL
jgi:hypothetical protein